MSDRSVNRPPRPTTTTPAPLPPSDADPAPMGRLQRQAPAIVALAAGLVLSGVLFYVSTRFEQRRTLSAFEQQVSGLEVPLQKGITGDLVVLGSIARFYAASEVVDATEFREFLRDTWIEHPGIEMLGWAPRVEPADVGTYEPRVVTEFKVNGGFRVHGAPRYRKPTGGATQPAETQPLYPLQYVEPADRHPDLLGLDIATLPGAREAIDRVAKAAANPAERVEAVATPPLMLDDGTAFDCLVVLPIFAEDAPGALPLSQRQARTTTTATTTPSATATSTAPFAGRRTIAGYAVGALQLRRLMQTALQDLRGQGIDVGLYDTTDPTVPPRLLYAPPGSPTRDVAALLASARDAAAAQAEDDRALVRATAVPIAGRYWTLVCAASPEFAANRRSFFRWGVLGTSLLFTALATAYLAALSGRAARITSVVASRTAELSHANTELLDQITARQQTEEALRKSEAVYHSLVETLPQNIFRKDLTGHFTFGNTNFGRELKASPDDIVGKTDHDFFPKNLADRYVEDDRRVIETGKPFQTVEEHVVPGGAKVYVEVIKTPVVANDGAIIGTQGIFWDVTTREEAKRLLHEKNRQLEEAARAEREAREALQKAQASMVQSEKLAALGQMVAGVAHEINNPLAFVSNNVAVLQRDLKACVELLKLYQRGEPALAEHDPALAAEIRDLSERLDLAYTIDNLDELLVRSRDGLKRIQQIVKDLREFARLDRSDYQEADLNAGVDSTINIIRGYAKKKQVQIVTDLGALPPVRCFPAKVNQVVMNLLTNAIDASKDHGTVYVRTFAENGDVCIQVKDEGSGIPLPVRERIFDPFFTTKPMGQGTGLGLSISYGIVQDHGGRIDLESEVGKGSVFTVVLPKGDGTGTSAKSDQD